MRASVFARLVPNRARPAAGARRGERVPSATASAQSVCVECAGGSGRAGLFLPSLWVTRPRGWLPRCLRHSDL